jgi:DNA helicase II / ATP-dependent DNA helicase PcrA
VDEFQDTNRQQMQLLRALAGERKNVCVVGDDDQSIYGWRGAEISNILEFERFFSNPTVVKLQENYRSVASILATANGVIRKNAGRREKSLIATRPGEEAVRLISMPGDKEESQLIVSEIWSGHHLQKRAFEDYAVLFRTNAQSRILEQTLREHNIPYRILGGQSFYERREVKDFLAYLHVCLNPDDDVNFLRIVNHPPRGLSDTTVSLATEASIQARRSVFATLADPEFTAQFTKKTQAAAEKFCQQIQRWRTALTTPGSDYASAAEEIIYEIDYIPYLKRSCSSPEEELNRESNLREITQTLYTHQRGGAKGLRDFLDSVSLDDDFSRESDAEKAAKKPGVWLITLHASKGLEFPHVYLVGLEQGILPHKRSLDEGTLDEERRLLYVGITRAMDKLTITHCHSRLKYGQTVSVQPSAFIPELPTPPVEKISYEDMQTRPLKDDDVAAQFAQLRAFLAQRSGPDQ